MRIVFVSNFLNHHQIPFCERMVTIGEKFWFVSTENTVGQGYQMPTIAQYVIDYNQRKDEVKKLIINADIVIFGSCPNDLIDLRMRENKLSFLYSERLFKKGDWRRFIPQTRKKVIERIIRYSDRQMYVLCASAYLTNDLFKMGFPIEKCYKWGYFPNIENVDIKTVLEERKADRRIKLLWVGRMLKWKHPEAAIKIAKELLKTNIKFEFNIVGDGPEKNKIVKKIQKQRLTNYINIVGSCNQHQVKCYMRNSDIFIMTSDFYEGWGAVINEAMGNGCAVVASHAAGATPFLIQDGFNGLIYKSGDISACIKKIRELINDSELRYKISKNAYEALHNVWNADVAAKRLILLTENLLNGKKEHLFKDGPCSQASIIKNNWF